MFLFEVGLCCCVIFLYKCFVSGDVLLGFLVLGIYSLIFVYICLVVYGDIVI